MKWDNIFELALCLAFGALVWSSFSVFFDMGFLSFKEAFHIWFAMVIGVIFTRWTDYTDERLKDKE